MISLKTAMVEIAYLGHSCFRIKGRTAAIVCDPYDSYVGFKMPKVEGEIVTVSHGHRDHSFIEGVKGEPFVISEPGEYEIKEVEILGFSTSHDEESGSERGGNVVYHFKIDNLGIVHLGDLGHKLSPERVEALNEVDVLLVPVGGVYTIDAAGAHEVIDQIEPKIVIPMHFKTKKHDAEVFGKVEGLEVFLKEMGEEKIDPEKKLRIKSRADLPEERKIVVLERG